MTIDLSAVPTLTDDLGLYDIPLNVDPFPYAQLQAQGRYPSQSTPNTLPQFLALLTALTRDQTPDMLSTDGNRNLNVNVAAGGGGGGVASATYGLAGVTYRDNKQGNSGASLFPAAAKYITDIELDVSALGVYGGGDGFGGWWYSCLSASFVAPVLMLATVAWPPSDPTVVPLQRHFSLHFAPAVDIAATFGVTADHLVWTAVGVEQDHHSNITARYTI